MQKHNELYTKILESYSSTLKDNIRTKRILKVLFFLLCSGLMITIIFNFMVILEKCTQIILNNPNKEFDIKSITTIISAISIAFISSFMYIPKLITRYLFNLNEDANMIEVIQNIQRHDLTIRKNINNTTKK